MSSLGISGKQSLVLVVGFDGTEPAVRALKAAAEMLDATTGRMEIVFVGHVPASVAFSPLAMASVEEGLDDEAAQLVDQVVELLRATSVKWHFQRRNGDIVPELIGAAAEQLDSEGPNSHLILVLGGSAHKIDRYLNSTPARVLRQDRFEVFVVP